MLLQELTEVPDPDPLLEQYPTPADIGADLIFRAFSSGDIRGKSIMEPACGKGLLALGTALMGASTITGFDLDPKAVETARQNLGCLRKKGFEIEGEFFPAALPIFSTEESWDTVVMNPPFGSQRRGADRPFLEFAAGHSNVIYSLHLAKTKDFVLRLLESFDFTAEVVGFYTFPIKHTFPFHTNEMVDFRVALVKGRRAGGVYK